jgi:hypothetical protein
LKSSPFIALLLAFAALATQFAGAGRDEPIQNRSDIPLAWNAEGQPTLERVQRAIIAGCARRGWQCRVTQPGEINAVLHVRQHMAESRITYDTQKFSVTYANSAELRHNGTKNTIHRKYNLWVLNLINDIQSAIAAAQ